MKTVRIVVVEVPKRRASAAHTCQIMWPLGGRGGIAALVSV